MGNHSRMVASELSGKATILSKATELGIKLCDDQVVYVLDEIKQMEHEEYRFEAADGSFELILRGAAGWTHGSSNLNRFVYSPSVANPKSSSPRQRSSSSSTANEW